MSNTGSVLHWILRVLGINFFFYMAHAMQKMPSNLCEVSRVCKNSSIEAFFSGDHHHARSWTYLVQSTEWLAKKWRRSEGCPEGDGVRSQRETRQSPTNSQPLEIQERLPKDTKSSGKFIGSTDRGSRKGWCHSISQHLCRPKHLELALVYPFLPFHMRGFRKSFCPDPRNVKGRHLVLLTCTAVTLAWAPTAVCLRYSNISLCVLLASALSFEKLLSRWYPEWPN